MPPPSFGQLEQRRRAVLRQQAQDRAGRKEGVPRKKRTPTDRQQSVVAATAMLESHHTPGAADDPAVVDPLVLRTYVDEMVLIRMALADLRLEARRIADQRAVLNAKNHTLQGILGAHMQALATDSLIVGRRRVAVSRTTRKKALPGADRAELFVARMHELTHGRNGRVPDDAAILALMAETASTVNDEVTVAVEDL
jgi:hypothetical protein